MLQCRWKEICQALALSQHQSGEITGLWHEFYSKVTDLMEQRKHIHQALSNRSHAGICGQEFAAEYLKVGTLKFVTWKNILALPAQLFWAIFDTTCGSLCTSLVLQLCSM